MADITQIIKKLKARDEAGLRMLYANYADALFGIAMRVLQNQAFAEDALQQSFLKVWNNIDTYDAKKATLFTWMANIVRNTSIDIKRLKSFQKEQKTETLDPIVHNTKTAVVDQDGIDAKSLINSIDKKYTIILEYLYLKGYTQRELADELDIPLGTVKTRVKKAIDLLRERLKNEKELFLGLFLLPIGLLKKLVP